MRLAAWIAYLIWAACLWRIYQVSHGWGYSLGLLSIPLIIKEARPKARRARERAPR